MTINKFQGKTQEEAIEKAKKELGEGAVIMNVKEIKPKGIFRAFKSSIFEVTAAMEEKETVISPMSALTPPKKIHENISLAADEQIVIPAPDHSETVAKAPVRPVTRIPQKSPQIIPEEEKEDKTPEKSFESRLDSLSSMLEEKLGTPKTQEPVEDKTQNSEELNFLRILYTTLLKNEVNEVYINNILDDVEQFIKPGNSVDMILANVYQKMILRFGKPSSIDLSGSKPKVIFMIGPTGVGKTTTIAKIASKYKVEQDKKVAFITADTYRIAATEQLRVYANILDAPMSVVYSADELNAAIHRMTEYDLIFVDTAGFSHKNEAQKNDTKALINGCDPSFAREVFLVLSATTKYKDLMDIIDNYREIASSYKLIFTKLDETSAYGNILNVKLYSGAELSYVTNGQNVPDDIEVFNIQKIVKQLLGGNN